MPIWLNEADVRHLVAMPELIDAMSATLAAFSSGNVRQPVRSVIQVGEKRAFFASMPAYLASDPAVGAKLVTVFECNGQRGLPTHQATIVLLDPATGMLQAVMDGRYITEARTAAVSAVAVQHLARKGAATLAILGSGVQAGSHWEALSFSGQFMEARCWSPSESKRRAFADHHPGVTAAANAEVAVRGADVIVLATSSIEPVLDDAWVSHGACVISVGACRPNQREMDPELITRARLFVDSRAAALQESGDVVMGMAEGRFGAEHIAGELGDIVNGAIPGRTDNDQVIVFKSLGLAAEDVAAAQLVYRRAQARGAGLMLT